MKQWQVKLMPYKPKKYESFDEDSMYKILFLVGFLETSLYKFEEDI